MSHQGLKQSSGYSYHSLFLHFQLRAQKQRVLIQPRGTRLFVQAVSSAPEYEIEIQITPDDQRDRISVAIFPKDSTGSRATFGNIGANSDTGCTTIKHQMITFLFQNQCARGTKSQAFATLPIKGLKHERHHLVLGSFSHHDPDQRRFQDTQRIRCLSDGTLMPLVQWVDSDERSGSNQLFCPNQYL